MIMDQTHGDHLKQIGELLQVSINTKDKQNAEKYAGILAQRGVKVTVAVEVNAQKDSQNNEFSIKVYVEDREASGGCISLKVKPTDTVQDLKNKMFLKHNFPVEVQKWIIGKRIPPDKETLHKARVTAGQAVYLYLVSAKSVKLKKDEYLAQREQLIHNQGHAMFSRPLTIGESGDYTTLGSPITPLTPYSQATPNTPNSHGHAFSKQKSKEGVAKGRQLGQGQIEQKFTHQRPLPTEQLDNQPLPEIRQETLDNASEVQVKPKEPKPQQIGWQCPACTFINLPTRPGCEICASDRPKTYVIPEGYRMTEEEEERLRRENELEKQVERAANVRRPGEVTDEDDDDVIENLPEDHLHALLQLNDELQQQYRAQQEMQQRADLINATPSIHGQIPLNIPPTGGHAPQQNVRNPIPATNEIQGNLDDLQFHMEPREIDFNSHDETD